MRVTSELFVSALLRRVFSSGGFAAVERKGASEAGAIFIRQRFRDGLETLYGPAPQAMFEPGEAGDRRFEIRIDHAEPEKAAEILTRETRFDPDLWIVELEIEALGDLLTLAEISGKEGKGWP